MCGITGIYAFNEVGRMHMLQLVRSTGLLSKRGPDHQGTFLDDLVGLGHRRLSILDTSYNGNQPMKDDKGRYTIVFNGEIYNYRKLREQLILEGHEFNSGTDTEVLLHLYIKYGEKCLDLLDGFFGFAVYDSQTKELFVARDRVGIKPLFFYHDEDKFVVASEMKAVHAYNIPKEIDYNSLQQYFQFNYIPSPNTMLKGFKKLMPGQFIRVKKKSVEIETYYKPPVEQEKIFSGSYQEAQAELRNLLKESVQQRLVSDVPLGCFLSGGIDSSVITALASKYNTNLETFSVGYADNPFFDETKYAEAVAKKHQTKHTTFKLTNKDLLDNLSGVLDYIDEPFADSSCIPVYILTKMTGKSMKVALSGDGADELFAGYNKYQGEYNIRNPRIQEKFAYAFKGLWGKLPQSRNDKFSNLFRQLTKFSEGMAMSNEDRYLSWSSFLSESSAKGLLSAKSQSKVVSSESSVRKNSILENLGSGKDINSVLRADYSLVLENDMLYKVDTMSMANSLEVRVPFLDHKLVEFAHSLPESYKINHNQKKRILQDAFRKELPHEVYNRPKKGFEVPLLDWFRSDLKSMICDDLLEDRFIEEQGVFDVDAIKQLKTKLFSNNPGDTHATTWALIVFQSWWKKYFKS